MNEKEAVKGTDEEIHRHCYCVLKAYKTGFACLLSFELLK